MARMTPGKTGVTAVIVLTVIGTLVYNFTVLEVKPKPVRSYERLIVAEWDTLDAVKYNRNVGLPNTVQSFETLTRRILDSMEAMRSSRNRTEYSSISVASPTKVADPNANEYLDVLHEYDNIDAWILYVERERFAEIFGDTFYDFLSSSCDVIRNRSLTYYRENEFNCRNGTAETAEMHLSRQFPSTLFEVGHPGQFKLSNKTHLSLFYILGIRSAVVSVRGDIYTRDLKIPMEHEPIWMALKPYIPPKRYPCKRNRNVKGVLPVKSIQSYDEVFAIGQWNGHDIYHFVTQQLVKLAPFVDFLKKHPTIRIHCTGMSKKKAYHKPWIALLGLDPARVVGGNVRANVVYSPESPQCTLPPGYPTALTSIILRRDMRTNGSRDLIILIKRSKKRYFKHHSEIATMVEKVARQHHLSLWIFDDKQLPSLNETRTKFHRAVAVLGPHGAGFANMLFCQPRTLVLEGVCYSNKGALTDGNINVCYRSMSLMLHHIWYGVVFPDRACFDYTADDFEKPLRDFLGRKSL